MSQLLYNWKRYWALRDGQGFHTDRNGFLLRSSFYKDTFEFVSMVETPALYFWVSQESERAKL